MTTAREALAKGREEIARWLTDKLAEELQVSPDDLDVSEPFASLGVSSIVGVSLAGEVGEALDLHLPATLFWDYPTVEKLAGYLAGLPQALPHAA